MDPTNDASFLRASDQALLVSFGERISLESHQQVLALAFALQNKPIAAAVNLHPAYCSLLIRFDACRASHEDIEREVLERMTQAPAQAAGTPREIEIPVCYGGDFGPDLEALAQLRGLSRHDVIRIHSDAEYVAYFLGFVPGFAYLGTVPEAIEAPRLASPRRRVEAGSVGIAGRQTAVYPCAVAGGWQLIGRTPLSMFRADREPMSLLGYGDRVRFRPISHDEYARIEQGGP
ncbi:MAG: 5-oxoprolinase subunit PxpB [Burkholderiaceae bacterium]|nr:5-oxoprolinase subunit PxpB [Burkholderiaceae bacterium]